ARGGAEASSRLAASPDDTREPESAAEEKQTGRFRHRIRRGEVEFDRVVAAAHRPVQRVAAGRTAEVGEIDDRLDRIPALPGAVAELRVPAGGPARDAQRIAHTAPVLTAARVRILPLEIAGAQPSAAADVDGVVIAVLVGAIASHVDREIAGGVEMAVVGAPSDREAGDDRDVQILSVGRHVGCLGIVLVTAPSWIEEPTVPPGPVF